MELPTLVATSVFVSPSERPILLNLQSVRPLPSLVLELNSSPNESWPWSGFCSQAPSLARSSTPTSRSREISVSTLSRRDGSQSSVSG